MSNLVNFIKETTNSELVNLIKDSDQKKFEKSSNDIRNLSKNVRYLLSNYKTNNQSVIDFGLNLDFELRKEMINRVRENKLIIY